MFNDLPNVEFRDSQLYPKVLTPAMNAKLEEFIAPSEHTRNMALAMQAISQMPLERLFFDDILDESKLSYPENLNEFASGDRTQRIPFFEALRDRARHLGLLDGNIGQIASKLKPDNSHQIDPDTATLPQVLNFMADQLDALNRQSHIVATAIIENSQHIRDLQKRILDPKTAICNVGGAFVAGEIERTGYSVDPKLAQLGSRLNMNSRYSPFRGMQSYGEIRSVLVKDLDTQGWGFDELHEMATFFTNWGQSVSERLRHGYYGYAPQPEAWSPERLHDGAHGFYFLLHLDKIDVFMEHKLPADLATQAQEATLFFKGLDKYPSNASAGSEKNKEENAAIFKDDIFHDAARDMLAQKQRLDRTRPYISRLQEHINNAGDYYDEGCGESIINPFGCDGHRPYTQMLQESSEGIRQAVIEAIELDCCTRVAEALGDQESATDYQNRKKRIYGNNLQELHILQHLSTQADNLMFEDHYERWKGIKERIQGVFGDNVNVPDWDDGMENCVDFLAQLNANWSHLESLRQKVKSSQPEEQQLAFDFQFANTLSDQGLQGALNVLSTISEQQGIAIEPVEPIQSIIPEKETYDVAENVSPYKRLAAAINWTKSLAKNTGALAQALKGYPVSNPNGVSPQSMLNECGEMLEGISADIVAIAEKYEQKPIPVTRPLKTTLRRAFKTAETTAERLLENASDKPNTLSAETIHNWQTPGEHPTNVGNVVWVLSALEQN